MASPEVGKKAPNFKVESSLDDEIRSLKNYKGEYLVLYFYPKDNTPGCTTQAITFSTLLDKFHDLGANVVGVSRDSMKSHLRFIEKKELTIELLADPDETMCNAYDVIGEKNMFGKKVKGIIRSTFLIDPNGKILHIWKKVKVDGHCEEVLEKLKEVTSE